MSINNISENLQELNDIKEEFKEAIESKNVPVSDESGLKDYPALIRSIQGGGENLVDLCPGVHSSNEITLNDNVENYREVIVVFRCGAEFKVFRSPIDIGMYGETTSCYEYFSGINSKIRFDDIELNEETGEHTIVGSYFVAFTIYGNKITINENTWHSIYVTKVFGVR